MKSRALIGPASSAGNVEVVHPVRASPVNQTASAVHLLNGDAAALRRRCAARSQRVVRVAYRQGDEPAAPAAPSTRTTSAVTATPVQQVSISVPIQPNVVTAAPMAAATSLTATMTVDVAAAPPAKPAVGASVAAAAPVAVAKAAEPVPPSSVPDPVAMKQPSSGAAQALAHPQPPVRAQLKVIGMGVRGISAVNRLIAAGTLPEAEFWALDSDKRVLSGADVAAHTLEVGPGDEASLSPEDLATLASGPAAAGQAAASEPLQLQGTAAAATSSGPDGHAGAVFVLGSAFGSPGGAPMMLQLVRHLRRQGYFVAATLTRPFEFEGARRLEAADALISTMEEVAHLVVVIAQGVLTRASAELTMGQAQAIADNTLVYTVQSTLWALRAPEILKVSHGAFLWHGRDLRNIKRPLFPPMMSLLSCPGHATLGRGQAALPLPLLQQAGLASALSTLAEDAVKAAAESPFLDHKLESATGVLCVLRVPPSALGVGARPAAAGPSSSTNTPLVADNHKEYALRSAVQVAAMTVRELVGRHCHDIIVCPQLCQDLESPSPRAKQLPQPQAAVVVPAGAESAGEGGAGDAQELVIQTQVESPDGTELVRVEVSLLVLESIEEMAEAKAVAGQKPDPAAAAAAAAAANMAAAAAADAAPTPTAATARDRIGSVISSRAPSTPRRPGPRPLSARGSGPSIFTGTIPGQPTPETVPMAASAAQPAWATGSAASAQQPAAPAAVASAAPPPQAPSARPSAAAAPAPAAPAGSGAGATAASAAAAAAANAAARKQARLASMSAMSALAGGSAAAVHNNILGASALGAAPPAQPTNTPAAGAGAAGFSPTGVPLNARGLPMYPQQQPAQPLAAAAEPEPAPAAPAPAANPFEGGLQQIPRLAESLVTSLVAQSLDLPPQAARWRHQQRTPAGTPRPPSPAFHLPRVDADVVEDGGSWMEGQAEAEPGLGRGLQQLIMGMRLPGMGGDGSGGAPGSGPPRPAAVRNRVAGMLDRERQD